MMKNLKIIKENINKVKQQVSALLVAGVMLTSASISASANNDKVTTQDVVNAMITGSKITAEITEEEANNLMAKAEKAVLDAGASLLPEVITERYENLKGLNVEEKTKQMAIIAMECDTLLYDGSAKLMTYPEAIQFSNVCDKVCSGLQSLGKKEIYSPKQSELLGEDIFTELEEIKKQASEIKDTKKTSYITAIGTDLGFYDDCFYKEPEDKYENPNTGINENKKYIAIMTASAAIALLSMKKKDKTKVYKK